MKSRFPLKSTQCIYPETDFTLAFRLSPPDADSLRMGRGLPDLRPTNEDPKVEEITNAVETIDD